MINQKRAQNQYLSWILIFGMVVALSFLLYNWSIEQATERTEELETRTDPLVCSELGISIDGSCQDFKSIKLNITNSNNVEVIGFILRTVGLYPEDDDYLQSKVIYDKIKSDNTKKFTILKKGSVSQITVVPIAKRNKKNIYCEEKAVIKEEGDLQQC